jgi:hypothetical protein
MRVVAGLIAVLVSVQTYASCSFGTSNEPSLQDVFDSILPTGAVSATNDCLAEGADAKWAANGQATATIVIELAGFASQNTFGIYDVSDPSHRATIFVGADGPGTTDTVQIMQTNGHYSVMDNGVWAANFNSPVFGYFLSTPQGNTFMSDTSLNTDGGDHMYAYQGNGTSTFKAGSHLDGQTFATNMYLLGFEDLAKPGWDRDYQDFVAAVQYVVPVPIPQGVVLLGIALAGLTRLRREARPKSV